jgi:beta-glucosidase
VTIDTSAFIVQTHDYIEPSVQERDVVREALNRLDTKEMAKLVRGGELQNIPPDVFYITGASGTTCYTLLDKGIPNIILSDGPAGINIANHVRVMPDGREIVVGVPEKYNWGKMAQMMCMMASKQDGVDVYRYATSWPVEELLAQSWDADLMEEIGKAIAKEMQEFGITIWLAPGMNIHRNPLCGRTFEYFSEDPFLTGKLAAAISRGVQSVSGKGVTLKHFCCNNQEDNRNYVSSNVNERALREIYLKGFSIAVKEASPAAIMTSYNKLNDVYTANRHDLCTDILCCEWGFRGAVMTDWNSCGNAGNGRPELCIPAGNDLIMPGSDYDEKCVLEALANGVISPKSLRNSAARVLNMVFSDNCSYEHIKAQ